MKAAAAEQFLGGGHRDGLQLHAPDPSRAPSVDLCLSTVTPKKHAGSLSEGHQRKRREGSLQPASPSSRMGLEGVG